MATREAELPATARRELIGQLLGQEENSTVEGVGFGKAVTGSPPGDLKAETMVMMLITVTPLCQVPQCAGHHVKHCAILSH
jgi:hypothetical protein